jgi:Na+-driven multidrug efflux pump
MLGAAMATGLSYCITIALMRYMIHKHLGLYAEPA